MQTSLVMRISRLTLLVIHCCLYVASTPVRWLPRAPLCEHWLSLSCQFTLATSEYLETRKLPDLSDLALSGALSCISESDPWRNLLSFTCENYIFGAWQCEDVCRFYQWDRDSVRKGWKVNKSAIIALNSFSGCELAVNTLLAGSFELQIAKMRHHRITENKVK